MTKRRRVLVIVLILILVSLSCFFIESISTIISIASLDESKHFQIEVDGDRFIYQGQTYILADPDYLFSVYENSGDELLSWNGIRYLQTLGNFCSYTSENPLFIYYYRASDPISGIYLREDYDYQTDVFVFDSTDTEIMLSDLFSSEKLNMHLKEQERLILVSKQCPRLYIAAKVAFIDNQWYISPVDSWDEAWKLSDETVKLLSDNDLI